MGWGRILTFSIVFRVGLLNFTLAENRKMERSEKRFWEFSLETVGFEAGAICSRSGSGGSSAPRSMTKMPAKPGNNKHRARHDGQAVVRAIHLRL